MQTTLNIRIDILHQINKAANDLGISRSEMIFFLLSRIAGEIGSPGKIGRLVQYQIRRRPEDWHVFHVRVREDMYEYWLDLRKLLKMSVSLILAYAAKKFLGEPTKIKYADNNLCKNYIIAKEVIDSVIVWKFIWGCPPNLSKYIHF
jgi:hypothetical protein